LNRDDWEELDRLLGLEGFGGYYDLVECLKDIAKSWIDDVKDQLKNYKEIVDKLNEIKTMKSAVNFLQAFSIVRRGKT